VTKFVPLWDGRLMHLAERRDGFGDWYARCQPPWGSVIRDKTLVANAVPTCLWCIVDARYA
jgi:hypothetical protein